MRIGFICIIPLLVIAVLAGCREEGRDEGPVTILFTGDDHGLLIPAG